MKRWASFKAANALSGKARLHLLSLDTPHWGGLGVENEHPHLRVTETEVTPPPQTWKTAFQDTEHQRAEEKSLKRCAHNCTQLPALRVSRLSYRERGHLLNWQSSWSVNKELGIKDNRTNRSRGRTPARESTEGYCQKPVEGFPKAACY